jgi:peptidyl-prolyl cis-trans isomerase SurA
MNRNVLKTLIALAIIMIIAKTELLKAQQDNDPVLMSINNEKVTKTEFLNVYKKNNINSQVLDKKSLDEYLNLYLNFKLKVCEAKEMGLDTSKSFKTELKGYRDQLAQPYLTDKEVTDELIKQAYDRMKWDIRASHILVKVKPNASPADTLAAYNKILKIKERIIKGEDFGKVAEEVSDDPSAKDNPEKKYTGNKGDLGFFTVFDMIYPFEDAVYSMKVGELSKPVRTEYGYHLIKVTDKRPAMGKVQVAHIYVSIPRNLTTEDSLKKYKARIIDIEQKLKAGGKFEDLAKQYSDDKGSGEKGGELPSFGVNRMVPEFIIAIADLKEKGDISRPVHTPYGWHLIKLIEKKGIGTFDEKKAEIKARLAKDSRSNKSREAFINKLKKEYNFNEDIKAKKEFYKIVTDSVFEGKWKINLAKDMKKSLFKLGDTVIYQQNFAKYISTHQGIRDKESIETFINDAYKDFTDDVITKYEDRHLEKKYLDFRLLMQEYRDGILLFDLTDKKVWTKAVKDTVGLEKYYQENKNKYMWGERLNAVTYTCLDDKVATDLQKLLKKADKKGYKEKDILEKINKDNKDNLKIETNFYSKGDNHIMDSIPWKTGMTDKFKNGKSIYIVNVIKIAQPEPKSLRDARGLVTADYQNYLEKEWIVSLKKKYKVEVNQAVFNSIK